MKRTGNFCVVLLAAVFALISCEKKETGRGAATNRDLSSHPIYSKYIYGKSSNVIDVGVQPLWIPANMIVETMGRDMVMRDAMTRLGKTIRFHAFLKGADVNYFLKRGDLEAGVGGDMPALSAAASVGARIVTLMQQGFCSIVARKRLLLGELRGKRIAYAFGSNAHYALLQALADAGLSEEDVKLVPMDVDQMPDALGRGAVMAMSAWEPAITIALARVAGAAVIHRSLSSGYLYFAPKFYRDQPETARQIIASELRALRWLRQEEQNLLKASRWAQRSGYKLSGQAPALAARQYFALARADLKGITSSPFMPRRDLEPGGRLFREFIFLKGLGLNRPDPGWSKVKECFDLSAVETISSDIIRYKLNSFRYRDHVR